VQCCIEPAEDLGDVDARGLGDLVGPASQPSQALQVLVGQLGQLSTHHDTVGVSFDGPLVPRRLAATSAPAPRIHSELLGRGAMAPDPAGWSTSRGPGRYVPHEHPQTIELPDGTTVHRTGSHPLDGAFVLRNRGCAGVT
jgi:hypothetical protein